MHYQAAKQFYKREGHLQAPGSTSNGPSATTRKNASIGWGPGSATSARVRRRCRRTGASSCPPSASAGVAAIVVTAVAALAAGYLLGRLRPWQRLGDWAADQVRFTRAWVRGDFGRHAEASGADAAGENPCRHDRNQDLREPTTADHEGGVVSIAVAPAGRHPAEPRGQRAEDHHAGL